MKVIKRNGKSENVSFDKVLYRIRKLIVDKALGLLEHAQADRVAQEVISKIFDGVTTEQLDTLSAQIAISLSIEHPDYGTLASRLAISNLHKKTTENFTSVMEKLYNNMDEQGNHSPLISTEIYEIIKKNRKTLNFVIDYNRDYLFDYFGFKTLERSYLMKINKEIVERPQHLWLRVSLGLHKNDIEKAIETYELMSQGYFIHATPTLFNSGTPRPANSSCFLISVDDSMQGIYKCLSDCALISKNSGGIGIAMTDIRAKDSYIRGTNGHSDGIVKMLKVFNETARYANQGGKRNGSFAVYMEPFHADIFDFLQMRRNVGDENLKCRDLFQALWVPDAFMRAIESDSDWFLMSPSVCTGLTESYGEEFEKLYFRYVADGKFVKQIKARELWNEILISQIETGMPYICYKDHVNRKSNQANIGIVKSSNLCAEITIVSSTKEYGTCNISTVGLPKYIEYDEDNKPVYNFQKLYDVVRIMTRNMNNVIDYNYYPVKETEVSNLAHRPIAIGAQGLANVFYQMKIPFESEKAKVLNKKIFETIQYASLYESKELAKKFGAYSSFEGSPASKGILQHDMWGVKGSDLWDWETLREEIVKYGLRNSLLTACPPTASTSQILGNYESFEPITSNLYLRSTLSGDYPVVNKYMIEDLQKLGLWNEETLNAIKANNGSLQSINGIPENIKRLYKTVWEISQKTLMSLSADRGAFVDQSQSLNLFFDDPTPNKLNSAHFHGWRIGLKTSMYYCRTRPKTKAQQFTVSVKAPEKPTEEEILSCSLENPSSCMMCSG